MYEKFGKNTGKRGVKYIIHYNEKMFGKSPWLSSISRYGRIQYGPCRALPLPLATLATTGLIPGSEGPFAALHVSAGWYGERAWAREHGASLGPERAAWPPARALPYAEACDTWCACENAADALAEVKASHLVRELAAGTPGGRLQRTARGLCPPGAGNRLEPVPPGGYRPRVWWRGYRSGVDARGLCDAAKPERLAAGSLGMWICTALQLQHRATWWARASRAPGQGLGPHRILVDRWTGHTLDVPTPVRGSIESSGLGASVGTTKCRAQGAHAIKVQMRGFRARLVQQHAAHPRRREMWRGGGG
ncbi:hypothetical protein DFH07DRAFT_766767 [Mycena maculata]|uniref:Uncharacterized protein n=1 Tax=Mycena maculata TaxID=230809 RepID=A0AAD7K1T4_9AGAR|nr:hypothetical protein DFH07DRAFT_766767 [Mycena maculata]